MQLGIVWNSMQIHKKGAEYTKSEIFIQSASEEKKRKDENNEVQRMVEQDLQWFWWLSSIIRSAGVIDTSLWIIRYPLFKKVGFSL